MKPFNRALVVLLPALLPSFAAAQVQPGMFSNIIIIVQENRTPDNLFGSYAGATCGGTANFPGADIVNGGAPGNGTNTCNASYAMNSGYDPNHQNADWKNDYDGGLMDGFCDAGEYTPPCPPYSYVQQSEVVPYFAIASTYGFANYMFQTNQGPSLEAHQFLFAGTSAPTAPNDANGYFWYFVKDNPGTATMSGCPQNTNLNWIDPRGISVAGQLSSECYAHDSLVTGAANCANGVCDKSVSWRYYAPSAGSIWDAPEAIPEVCYGVNDTTHAGISQCGTVSTGNTTEWNLHMSFYTSFNLAPIFQDINHCNLAQISWVIPDEAWSDHPVLGGNGTALGPSWVGDIVNSIGASYTNSNGLCDYWGTNSTNKKPTAIFIVWDDWGGFYDHVPPYEVLKGSRNGNSWSCPAPATNQWGCGYTYGFRVPFLVVSEYTGTKSGTNYVGYISGACGTTGQPSCPNTNKIYQHDFGSILAFTEYNFNLPKIAPPLYADNNTIDSFNGNVPLSDFFSLYTGSGSIGRPFVQIPITQYPPSFFQNYYATHNATPTGPDTD
jgi:phospholipase C